MIRHVHITGTKEELLHALALAADEIELSSGNYVNGSIEAEGVTLHFTDQPMFGREDEIVASLK